METNYYISGMSARFFNLADALVAAVQEANNSQDVQHIHREVVYSDGTEEKHLASVYPGVD